MQKDLTTDFLPFTKQHKKLLAILTALFCLFTLLQIHGYSTPEWKKHIEGRTRTRPPEILINYSREVRMDDFILDIPMILSQLSHTPKFPLVNKNTGFGMNMLAPIKVPVWGITLLFRPVTWGFLLNAHTGVSFMWWSLFFGVFYSAFLLFFFLTDNQFKISILAALVVLFSPFIQFWSFHKAEIPIHGIFTMLGFLAIFFSHKKTCILLGGVILGWSAGCFALDHIYPPYQVSMGYLFAFLSLGILWERKDRIQFSTHRNFRFSALFIGFALAFLALVLFYVDARDLITNLSNTIYPGKRFSDGGGYSWIFLFLNNFLLKPVIDWTKVGNVCEQSCFLLFFPLVILGSFFLEGKKPLKKYALDLVLVGYLLLLITYTFIGIPHRLASLTFLGKMTVNRTQMAISYIDIILLVRFIGRNLKRSFSKKALSVMLCLWTLGVILVANYTYTMLRPINLAYFIFISFLNIFLGYLLLTHKQRFLSCLALLSFIYTCGFNPIVHRIDYLYDNPLSKKILELDKESHHAARWIVYGGGEAIAQSTLLRILGVKSLGGYQGEVQWKLWELFDPVKKFTNYYNRMGYVRFLPGGMEAGFSENYAEFDIKISPASPVLKELNVNYILAVNEKEYLFEGVGGFKKIYSLGPTTIFSRQHD